MIDVWSWNQAQTPPQFNYCDNEYKSLSRNRVINATRLKAKTIASCTFLLSKTKQCDMQHSSTAFRIFIKRFPKRSPFLTDSFPCYGFEKERRFSRNLVGKAGIFKEQTKKVNCQFLSQFDGKLTFAPQKRAIIVDEALLPNAHAE